ncbi:hypothetical protein K493DRAFT_317213 [Basidiobolus meristosporus CBS 931.73]|uniref:Uncharacterized protein n=1 Tax=Basidiobolus meristosporus CBS 931.73 TaxID=1314790 RepID=A0A1Y1Y0L3_9FUNG|nr:hypothetical protein K493DRAFT_317213 [Basidiobolus meristosporus CBS 931.73]|eukprot:ORX91552.1 hypothetical protein K493DRAFT_317213 [Basidiobolus meristosporus CBS 931.73]
MSNLMLETQTLHTFPHFTHQEHEIEPATVPVESVSEKPDPHQELLQFVNNVRLPTKQEFRDIVQDKQKSTELYSTLLDTCEQLDKLTKDSQTEAPACIDDLPQYWTVLGSPYYQKARTMALRQFHSPQSSYFLPNSDEMIFEIVKSWNVFPSSILKSQHGRERVLAWIKTFYALERAAVRNKVVGVRMSVRNHRKLDGKALTQSILPEGYPVTHQMVKRAVLMRDTSKRRGSWSNMDKEREFWNHYQEALVDLRDMSRHEAESHLTSLVKKDQEHHGKF